MRLFIATICFVECKIAFVWLQLFLAFRICKNHTNFPNVKAAQTPILLYNYIDMTHKVCRHDGITWYINAKTIHNWNTCFQAQKNIKLFPQIFRVYFLYMLTVVAKLTQHRKVFSPCFFKGFSRCITQLNETKTVCSWPSLIRYQNYLIII